MDDLFKDDRLQFFLRNRNDIKAWAAIESEVITATRELFARSQSLIEERLLAVDPTVVVGRHDSSPWERILARHDSWPETVGLALEWHRNVDPTGGTITTIGVFWWAVPESLVAPRERFRLSVANVGLQELGYKIPPEGAWAVSARLVARGDWWQSPGPWMEEIATRLASTWPLVATAIDAALDDNAQVIGA